MNEFVPRETGCKYITFLKDNEISKNFSGCRVQNAGCPKFRTEYLPLPFIRHPASGIQYHLMTFSSILISWYQANKRDLPFRGITDPYRIWVSEVILQQTRMEQGIGYYLRFIERFPDIFSLARATEEEVLKAWQGLGYYSRARNLHSSARDIVERLGGVFPQTYEEIVKLKGIGEYSAASIASLAFSEPRAAVDGNVYRFFARHFGFRDPVGSSSGKKRITEKAGLLMDTTQPGTFNQAMIEFGALVCTPQNPACSECVFMEYCVALKHDVVREIPVRSKAVKVRERYFHYFIITFTSDQRKRVIISKRTANDVWKNLYDFPLIETNARLSLSQLKKTTLWSSLIGTAKPLKVMASEEFRHLLSHQVILAVFYHAEVSAPPAGMEMDIDLEEMESIPLPRLIARYWQKYFHL